MEISLHPYNEKDLSISESFAEFTHETAYKKSSSVLNNYKLFENAFLESEKMVTDKKTNNNFKHLIISDIKNEELDLEESPEEKKTRRQLNRRSLTAPTKKNDAFHDLDLKKKTKVKKLDFGEGFARSNEISIFSERNFLQRESFLSSRDPLNTFKAIKKLKSLDEFKFVEESKEISVNDKFRKKLKKHLELHDSDSFYTCSATALDEMAKSFFEDEILKEIKTNFNLKRTSSIDLVKSELPRAQSALVKLQKSMILVKGLISHIEFLQDSIIQVLSQKNKERKIANKTRWINDFFNGLDQMISSYKFSHEEINPLKTFTYLLEDKTKDAKSMDLLLVALKLKKKDFENLLICCNNWADLKMLYFLASRVGELDHQNIKKCLNFSADHIVLQEHEWYESIFSKNSHFQIPIAEIVNEFSPEYLANYKEMTVNEEPIRLVGFKGTRRTSQCEFLTELLDAIYSSGFNRKMKKEECQNQANVLVNIELITKSIQNDLLQEEISWATIEKKLNAYPAIPFLKFKTSYSLNLHKACLDQFLVELSVPCISVLKLNTNSCWLKADLCIRHLFGGIFTVSTEIQTEPKLGSITHLQIKDNEQFSAVHFKHYEIYSTANKAIDYANITFKWNVALHYDESNQAICLKGILTVQNVKIYDAANEEIKINILKTLNNPNIVDYVTDSLCGSPTIFTTFK